MGSHTTTVNHYTGDAKHNPEIHVTSFKTYMNVALGLFALTFLTIGAHALRQYIAPFSAFVAFAIATVKALLVIMYFMHQKYETKINRAVFISGFIFLAVLFVFSVLDIYTRINQGSVL